VLRLLDDARDPSIGELSRSASPASDQAAAIPGMGCWRPGFAGCARQNRAGKTGHEATNLQPVTKEEPLPNPVRFMIDPMAN
jgi:hypothetical protein